MKILIELPTWLGDSIMATPAIENLLNSFNNPEVTLIGSYVAIEAIKNHPKVVKTYVLDKKYVNFYRIIKSFGKFEIYFSFRGSLRSKCMSLFILAENKYQFDKNKYNKGHQVEKYNNFVNDNLRVVSTPGKLILHLDKKNVVEGKKLLGINPGASYGSSKRWYPEEFAKVAVDLSKHFDIIIFGGPGEKEIALDIENFLIKKSVTNYQNLADKTSVQELIDQISNLDLFITGDSGPMHIAAVFKIPTISIFGPTQDNETSQWQNKKSIIIKKNLTCQPCMKRNCPLGHHNCMKLIKAREVLSAVDLIS
jgi:heptosyltransferase II